MNKTFVTTATLGLLACTAHAQSSVTLYGLVDNGLNIVNNAGGSRQYFMASSIGQIQGSRWGIKGVEDLGNGYTATVNLEDGFETNTGKFSQQGLLFGRGAYVGLGSPYGRFTLGRQNTSLLDFVAASLIPSGIWGGTFIAHAGDVDNLNNTFRENSAIKYTSPSYHGFFVSGEYGFGGQAGAFNRYSSYGGGIGYNGGPLRAGIAFTDMQDPYISAFNNGANAAVAQQSPIFSGYVSARSLQIFAAGLTYKIGQATLGTNYSNSRFVKLGADLGNAGAVAGLTGTAVFNNIEVNFAYQVNLPVTLYAALNRTTRSSVQQDGGAVYNQAAVGAGYRFSVRTDLYFSAVYQHASGRDSTGHIAVAALDNATPSTNNHQVALRFGIRHLF